MFVIAAATSLVVSMAGASCADTPPAPPLDMREYQAYSKHGQPDSTFSATVRLPTKLLGNVVFFSYSNMYAMIDTAYSRWVMQAYRDYYMGETKIVPAVDKAITSEGWIVKTSIDRSGKITLDHIVPGSYIVFGGVQLRTGVPHDTTTGMAGYTAEGIETTVPIPTLSFTDVRVETLYFEIPFQVTAQHSSVTGTPQLIADRVDQ